MQKLLLVHDDLAAVAALRRALEPAWRVMLAVNVSDAREIASAERPQAALVAASCDGGEGAQLAAQLLSGERPRIPVVLLEAGSSAGAERPGEGGPARRRPGEEDVGREGGGAGDLVAYRRAPGGWIALPSCTPAEEIAQVVADEARLAAAAAAGSLAGGAALPTPGEPGADLRMLSEALRVRAEELRQEAWTAEALREPASADEPDGPREDQATDLRLRAGSEERRRVEEAAAGELSRAFQARADEEASRAAALPDARALFARGERAGEARRGHPPATAPSPSRRAPSSERVDAVLALVKRADYFAILGVERGAPASEVERAAESLLAELAPEAAGPGFGGTSTGKGDERDGLIAARRVIAEVVTEAREVLRDDVLRAAYLAAIRSG